jgi:folylpolyglutamate synthase
MYTSPHLHTVRERIQIDGSPISESLFAKYFFQVWDRLESGGADKPTYFRFLTVLAFHTYLCEKVDAAIFEVGIGGEYCATNVIEKPTAVGITSLGIDHTHVLGDSIEQIAWHKAGIIKPGRPALTVEQPPEALTVIRNRGLERGVTVMVVPIHESIESGAVKLGLPAKCMLSNGSLAITLATEHLKAVGIDPGPTDRIVPEKFVKGLAEVDWPGRCQVTRNGRLEWCVDGAHTVESLAACGDWYASIVNRYPPIPPSNKHRISSCRT